MKKTILIVLLTLAIAIPAVAADINGLWKFHGNNQTMIFFQEGTAIKVMCTYRSGSNVITWHGQGTISGNNLRYTLHHANTADNGDYEQVFTVAPDGKSMSGTYGRVGNVQGNWSLERVGP